MEERRETDGRDGEFGALAVDDGLAVRIDDDFRRKARADGERVRGGRSGDCCGQGEAGDSHGLELRRLPVSAQLARDVAAHRPDRAVGGLEQRVEFPGGGVDDVAGDERGRVARGGVAEAELAVVVEPHAPERAVALDEEGVAMSGRDSRDVLGDDDFVLAVLKRAVAELAVGVVAHRPERTVVLDEERMGAAGGDGDGALRDERCIEARRRGAVAKLAVRVEAHGVERAGVLDEERMRVAGGDGHDVIAIVHACGRCARRCAAGAELAAGVVACGVEIAVVVEQQRVALARGDADEIVRGGEQDGREAWRRGAVAELAEGVAAGCAARAVGTQEDRVRGAGRREHRGDARVESVRGVVAGGADAELAEGVAAPDEAGGRSDGDAGGAAQGHAGGVGGHELVEAGVRGRDVGEDERVAVGAGDGRAVLEPLEVEGRAPDDIGLERHRVALVGGLTRRRVYFGGVGDAAARKFDDERIRRTVIGETGLEQETSARQRTEDHREFICFARRNRGGEVDDGEVVGARPGHDDIAERQVDGAVVCDREAVRHRLAEVAVAEGGAVGRAGEDAAGHQGAGGVAKLEARDLVGEGVCLERFSLARRIHAYIAEKRSRGRAGKDDDLGGGLAQDGRGDPAERHVRHIRTVAKIRTGDDDFEAARP